MGTAYKGLIHVHIHAIPPEVVFFFEKIPELCCVALSFFLSVSWMIEVMQVYRLTILVTMCGLVVPLDVRASEPRQ